MAQLGCAATVTERRQSRVFGEVAELYHRHRPDYPSSLFDWIVDRAELAPGARILDIGAGTGKSSTWFVGRGHHVTAVEPDQAMGEVARSSAAASGRLTVEVAALQDFDPGERRWDLAVSGQAWHWADPATRFADVAACLSPTGRLCVFWNRPDVAERPFAEEIDEVYLRCAPDLARGLAAVQFPGSKSAVSAATPSDEFDNSGLFEQVELREIGWSREVTTEDHCSNLRTQSDHRMLDPGVLETLIDSIAEIIDRHGGRYDLGYTTHAYLARVRS